MITDRNETSNVIGSFSDSFLNDLKEEVITWNCSANWSYWGYDYLPEAYDPVDEEWKGLREVTCEDVPTSPLSAIESEASIINIFPNPINDTITINGQSKNYKINIYNLKGVLISSHNAKGLQTKINLSVCLQAPILLNSKTQIKKLQNSEKYLSKIN